ncbi:centrosomal protein CEP120, putative (CEP120) [Plasmodium malariae]|uniref:Centrosomal protein CEP120, putative (CEP120) n=1 Tax=Plasmodium malariae TaxID=5858 RepID=A0A1A8X3S3_PLAMA|nr:centrosomal protein CEP120, putative (CEP120) [Plasmodium malariae]
MNSESISTRLRKCKSITEQKEDTHTKVCNDEGKETHNTIFSNDEKEIGKLGVIETDEDTGADNYDDSFSINETDNYAANEEACYDANEEACYATNEVECYATNEVECYAANKSAYYGVHQPNNRTDPRTEREIDGNQFKERGFYKKRKGEMQNMDHGQNSNYTINNETINTSRLCELKEIYQLGEQRKKILNNFNELYYTKGQSITNALIEIFELNINDEIILYILQKVLHVHGLCVPCYKFGSNRNSCNLKINCKWCHHYTHLNEHSPLHPLKMLHFKNKCKVCNHFIEGRFCFLLNECQFCHSIDHLPKNLKKHYFDILNSLYKKRKYAHVITKDLLDHLGSEKDEVSNLGDVTKDLMILFDRDEKNKGTYNNIVNYNNGHDDYNNDHNIGGDDCNAERVSDSDNYSYDPNNGSAYYNGKHNIDINDYSNDRTNCNNRSDRGTDSVIVNLLNRNNMYSNTKKSYDTCNECSEGGRKPCSNHFLYQKDCHSNCNNCHNEIHKNKNSNLYILTYHHDNNMCIVCPSINEAKCSCDHTSIYCHHTDHISYKIKVKNVLHDWTFSLRNEFCVTREQRKSIPENDLTEKERGTVHEHRVRELKEYVHDEENELGNFTHSRHMEVRRKRPLYDSTHNEREHNKSHKKRRNNNTTTTTANTTNTTTDATTANTTANTTNTTTDATTANTTTTTTTNNNNNKQYDGDLRSQDVDPIMEKSNVYMENDSGSDKDYVLYVRDKTYDEDERAEKSIKKEKYKKEQPYNFGHPTNEGIYYSSKHRSSTYNKGGNYSENRRKYDDKSIYNLQKRKINYMEKQVERGGIHAEGLYNNFPHIAKNYSLYSATRWERSEYKKGTQERRVHERSKHKDKHKHIDKHTHKHGVKDEVKDKHTDEYKYKRIHTRNVPHGSTINCEDAKWKGKNSHTNYSKVNENFIEHDESLKNDSCVRVQERNTPNEERDKHDKVNSKEKEYSNQYNNNDSRTCLTNEERNMFSKNTYEGKCTGETLTECLLRIMAKIVIMKHIGMGKVYFVSTKQNEVLGGNYWSKRRGISRSASVASNCADASSFTSYGEYEKKED